MWRRWDALRAEAQPGPFWLTLAGVLISLPLYVFGRAYDFISLEALGLYGFCLSLMHNRFGLRAMMANWFPLFYLGLLLPAPGWMIDQLTAPLKLLVTTLATAIVEPSGIPILQQGVTMTVGPYQLLVEDACSGMNSLIGLIAITLFYIYLLRNASWRYAAFLVCLVVPIAIAANVVRIIFLILLTYFMGDAVGQGFLHMTAGLFLFALSLLLMFTIDNLASRALAAIRRRRDAAA
jgi:exosortase